MTRNKIRTDWQPHDGGQREIFNSDARFRIIACGRRWGKTDLAARIAADHAGQTGEKIWWVAPTYDISDVGFETVRAALPEQVIDESKQTKPKQIELVNGTTVSFRSADREDSLRAVGLDLLIIDEAAMVPKRAWTEELRPTLSDTLGDMVAISTPKGRGWFFEWWQRGQSPDHTNTASWQYSTFTNPHVPDSEIEDARLEIPQHVFEQEYLAEFKEESGGVFTGLDDRLFTAEYDIPVAPENVVHPCSIGVDLARHQDYRVITVVDAAGQIVYWDREQGETWPQIQREVSDVARQYEGVVMIDASRDNKLVADLEAEGLRIEPVHFSSQRKQELIENLIATIEADDLSAPEIETLRHELEVFEYDVSRAGNIRYDAPEGFHDDTVDSLALAVDGMEHAGGAASTTATVGTDSDTTTGDGLDAIVQQQSQQRYNNGGWK